MVLRLKWDYWKGVDKVSRQLDRHRDWVILPNKLIFQDWNPIFNTRLTWS